MGKKKKKVNGSKRRIWVKQDGAQLWRVMETQGKKMRFLASNRADPIKMEGNGSLMLGR